jgi:ribose transport system permease protein
MATFISRSLYAVPSMVVLAMLLVANALASPTFLDHANWNSFLIGATPLMIMGMAQALPVMAGGGGLDLSVGPLAALVNVTIASVLAESRLSDPLSMSAVVILIGILSGLLNGVLVAVVRVQPIIATLATYLAYQGLTLEIQPMAGGGSPEWLQVFTTTHFGVPGMVFILIGVGVAWTVLRNTAFGRNLLAVGGDVRAAYTAGVDVALIRVLAYVVAGVLAALVGLIFTAIMSSGDPTIGTPYTLTSIAAVALGGVSLSGGRGGLLGPAAAGAMLFLIQNLFTVAQVSIFYLQIFYGLILIAALAMNALPGAFPLVVFSGKNPLSRNVRGQGL